MPRLVNKPPKYSLHKPSGQAKVRFNGKDTYLGRYGSPESKEAYAQFVASLPKPSEQGRLADPSPGVALLVGECVERYQEHAQRYYVHPDGSQTGEALTIRVLLRPVLQKFAELPAREFGPKKLKQVREYLIALGWTRYSINKSTSVTKRCFTWCASEELIPPNIAMGLRTVAGLQKNRTAAREKDPIRPVADEHVDTVLPIVSEIVSDVCRLMRLTGMRPGEVLAMIAVEIDRTDPSCWVYRPGRHKTAHKDKPRVVFIGERGQQILLARILKAGEGPLFPITRAALRRSIHRGCKRAGIPNWHPNQIRHTVGTEVRARYGLEAAQVLLGHSRADVTQTYAERDLAKAADVARKIG
jgi:integrase